MLASPPTLPRRQRLTTVAGLALPLYLAPSSYSLILSPFAHLPLSYSDRFLLASFVLLLTPISWILIQWSPNDNFPYHNRVHSDTWALTNKTKNRSMRDLILTLVSRPRRPIWKDPHQELALLFKSSRFSTGFSDCQICRHRRQQDRRDPTSQNACLKLPNNSQVSPQVVQALHDLLMIGPQGSRAQDRRPNGLK